MTSGHVLSKRTRINDMFLDILTLRAQLFQLDAVQGLFQAFHVSADEVLLKHNTPSNLRETSGQHKQWRVSDNTSTSRWWSLPSKRLTTLSLSLSLAMSTAFLPSSFVSWTCREAFKSQQPNSSYTSQLNTCITLPLHCILRLSVRVLVRGRGCLWQLRSWVVSGWTCLERARPIRFQVNDELPQCFLIKIPDLVENAVQIKTIQYWWPS